MTRLRSCSPLFRVLALLSCVVCWPVVALDGLQQFRISVDVAMVDVTIVDSQGNPVEGFTPADFEVTVAKRQSRVLAVNYFSLTGGASPFGERAPDTSVPQVDMHSRRSRSVIFLLDDLSFLPEPARELGMALDRLLPLLPDNDVVGVTTTSGLGPDVAPTVERSGVRAAVSRFRGRRDLSTGPFVVGIDEALALEVRATSSRIVSRECELLQLGPGCGSMVLSAARNEASAAIRRMEEQLDAIAGTIASMKNLAEPRLLILVSDGVAAEARHGLVPKLRAVREAAASAGVQMYALTGAGDGADARDRTPERRAARTSERRYLASGVQTVATAAGGESFVVVGQPDRFLRRIVLETTAAYQLAVEIPSVSEAGGQFLEIRVKVKRRGVDVRVRPLALRVRAPSRAPAF